MPAKAISPERLALLKEMRQQSTEAERFFWQCVKAGRHQGLKFRREHPIGPFIVDFYCHSKSLVIEIDGGIHDEEQNQRDDNDRQKALEALGYRVVRFTNAEVLGLGKAILERL